MSAGSPLQRALDVLCGHGLERSIGTVQQLWDLVLLKFLEDWDHSDAFTPLTVPGPSAAAVLDGAARMPGLLPKARALQRDGRTFTLPTAAVAEVCTELARLPRLDQARLGALERDLVEELAAYLCTSCGRPLVGPRCGPGCRVERIAHVGQLRGWEIGRYRIELLLGAAGGSGGVLRARDAALDRHVAIKVLHPFDKGALIAPVASTRARFAREARMLACLEHPQVPRIYDVELQAPLPMIVMEYVQGVPLTQVTPSGWEEALAWTLDVTRVVRHVHEQPAGSQRINLHRDIKPANVLRGVDGRMRLVDFGLARGFDTTTLTQHGMRGGSVGFSSPEQFKDMRTTDARADLFSLGALAYWLITQEAPFTDRCTTVEDFLLRDQDPVSPMPAGACPQAVEAYICRLLSRDPAARPATAAEVEDALVALLAQHGASALAGLPHARVEQARAAAEEALERAQRAGFCLEGATDAVRRARTATDPDQAEAAAERARQLAEDAEQRASIFDRVVVVLADARAVGAAPAELDARRDAARSARSASALGRELDRAESLLASAQEAARHQLARRVEGTRAVQRATAFGHRVDQAQALLDQLVAGVDPDQRLRDLVALAEDAEAQAGPDARPAAAPDPAERTHALYAERLRAGTAVGMGVGEDFDIRRVRYVGVRHAMAVLAERGGEGLAQERLACFALDGRRPEGELEPNAVVDGWTVYGLGAEAWPVRAVVTPLPRRAFSWLANELTGLAERLARQDLAPCWDTVVIRPPVPGGGLCALHVQPLRGVSPYLEAARLLRRFCDDRWVQATAHLERVLADPTAHPLLPLPPTEEYPADSGIAHRPRHHDSEGWAWASRRRGRERWYALLHVSVRDTVPRWGAVAAARAQDAVDELLDGCTRLPSPVAEQHLAALTESAPHGQGVVVLDDRGVVGWALAGDVVLQALGEDGLVREHHPYGTRPVRAEERLVLRSGNAHLTDARIQEVLRSAPHPAVAAERLVARSLGSALVLDPGATSDELPEPAPTVRLGERGQESVLPPRIALPRPLPTTRSQRTPARVVTYGGLSVGLVLCAAVFMGTVRSMLDVQLTALGGVVAALLGLLGLATAGLGGVLFAALVLDDDSWTFSLCAGAIALAALVPFLP